MDIDGVHCESIWADENREVRIIDQRFLPHKLVVETLETVQDAFNAIKEMHVRGAPLIGATAAFGMFFAVKEAKGDERLFLDFAEKLKNARPTAADLALAINMQLDAIQKEESLEGKIEAAFKNSLKIASDSREQCRLIGEHGLKIISEISAKKNGEPVNILTHCNAGWLACIDFGTATAPIYAAFDKGIKLHVWVDETRPRNQGALTAWELGRHGIPHTVIVDNAGGHLMQHNLVDLVIVGTDRTTRKGDAANKIGTYLKALAAKDNKVPFYVALPSNTIDWKMSDGLEEIPIEERSQEEVRLVQGLCGEELEKVLVFPESSPAKNFGFDVTPARLITGLITERGVCKPDEKSLLELFPENK